MPVHFAILFGAGIGVFLTYGLALTLLVQLKERSLSKRIALSETGILIPSHGKHPGEIEVDYVAIDALYLHHNCQGRRLVIGYPGGAELIWEERMASRKAFKDLRRLLADRICLARSARGLAPPRRRPACRPDARAMNSARS